VQAGLCPPTYGSRLRSDGFYARAVSWFIDQALSNRDITIYGKGDETRSFCYVADSVTTILLAATREEMTAQVVNTGNPHEVTIENARVIFGETISYPSDPVGWAVLSGKMSASFFPGFDCSRG